MATRVFSIEVHKTLLQALVQVAVYGWLEDPFFRQLVSELQLLARAPDRLLLAIVGLGFLVSDMDALSKGQAGG